MESSTDISPLVVIAGPTGSGKTSLAIQLAQKFNGEIICADSRTVYKGMEIGTAKPTESERAKVPHHLIDISTPDQSITAADFKKLAQAAIIEVAARGKVPFLVGGTGLFIDAVLYNFAFSGTPDPELRAQLDKLSVPELQERLSKAGVQLPENAMNRRHLIRQVETGGWQAKQTQLRSNTLVIRLEVDPDLLKERIATRLAAMFDAGLEGEVRGLVKSYSWDCRALHTIGYQEFEPYFSGGAELADVRQKILTHSLQYAKRQKTWFKRNKHMHYIRSFDEAADLVTTFLNKKAAQ